MAKRQQPGRIQRNFQQPEALGATAQQFSKLNVDGLKGVMNGSKKWVEIPTYYYDFEQLCLPLTVEECDDKFGGTEIPIFNVSALPNRFTNAAIGSGVNEVFLALGAGVIAMGEGEAFSVAGARVLMPETQGNTPSISGLEGSTSDCFCGVVNLVSSAEGSSNAVFWWGGPTWKVIEKFFRSYRLVIKLAHRFEIVNESLFDVGMTPTPPEFVGASDSKIPSGPFIRAANNVTAAKGGQDAFAPLTVAGGVDAPGVTCVGPPLVPVTYGHPRITGLANRMYCFSQPIMFIPGMSFEVFFQQAAPVCAPDICEIATIQDITIGDRFTQTIIATDQAQTQLECGSTFHFPGGTVDLGVVFKGFALWPSAAVHYLQKFLTGGSAMCQALAEGGVMNGILGSAIGHFDQDGLIAGVLAAKPEDIR